VTAGGGPRRPDHPAADRPAADRRSSGHRRRRGESARAVPRRFYAGDPVEVAPTLLNKLLVRDGRVGRIVEVEAYRGAEDPASHAFRGMTARNATMFGPPGRLYVYFTYGMHFCANVVCWPEGLAGAVLLRALAPVAGIEAMRSARSLARRAGPGTGGAGDTARAASLPDRLLASGPARLCQALGVTRVEDGADLVTGVGGMQLLDDGVAPPRQPAVSLRVGIKVAVDRPWRWFVPGDPNVSRGAMPTADPGAGMGPVERRGRARPTSPGGRTPRSR